MRFGWKCHLFNLKKQGLIEDYFITDPSLFDVPDDFVFDVVWLQRCNDPKLRDLLEAKIGNNFMYDLDDLLIGGAAYREDRLSHKEVIHDLVKQCRVLVVTSLRLGPIAGSLRRRVLGRKTGRMPECA